MHASLNVTGSKVPSLGGVCKDELVNPPLIEPEHSSYIRRVPGK